MSKKLPDSENVKAQFDAPKVDEELLEQLEQAFDNQQITGDQTRRDAPGAKLFGLIDRVRKSDALKSNRAAQETRGSDVLRETPQDQKGDEDLLCEPHPGSRKDPGSFLSGKTFGRFEILRSLGSGGFGIVFLANDPQLERQVALKIPRPEFVLTDDLKKRFEREARAAAALSHPNIVPVFEYGDIGMANYIASQFVDGMTLAEWIKQHNQPIDPTLSAEIVMTLADAVQHAHQRGVVHRDLKPGNVLLEEVERVNQGGPQFDQQNQMSPANKDRRHGKVGDFSDLTGSSDFWPLITDFGLARIVDDQIRQTKTDAIVGTPAYMSPEQARGDRGDQTAPEEASDIYSLGAILYELMTGRPPFVKPSVLETLQALQTQEPKRPSRLNPAVSKDLEAICLKCLEKSPGKRYKSAFDLQTDLKRWLNNRPVAARPVTNWNRLGKWRKRNPSLAAALACLSVAIIIGLIGMTALWWRADNLRREAEASRLIATDKSRQLTMAVDELLTAIAETPELKLHGMEPLRRKLLEKSNEFYQQFLAEKPDDPLLQAEYAEILNRLARVHSELGDHEGAIDLAEQMLHELPPLESSDRRQKWLRAAARVFIGQQAFFCGEDRKPKGLLEAAEATARDVYKSEPKDDFANAEFAMTLSSIADGLITIGERADSNRLSLESIQHWQQVEPDFVEANGYTVRMGQTLMIAGRALAASEKMNDARPRLEDAIVLLEPYLLDSSAADPKCLSILAEAYRLLGKVNYREFDVAQHLFHRSLDLYEQLIAKHPLVPSYRIRANNARHDFAMVHFLAGELPEAANILQAGIVELETMLAQQPTESSLIRRSLADRLSMLGMVLGEQNKLPEKLESLERARDLILKMIEDTGGRTDHQLSLAGVDGNLGRCFVQMGEYEKAIAILEDCQPRLQSIMKEDPANGTARRYYGVNLANLVLAHGGAKHWQQALEYLHQLADDYPSAANRLNRLSIVYLVHAGQLDSALSKLQSYARQTSDAGSIALTCSDVLKAISESQSKFDSNEQNRAVAAITERGLQCVKQIHEHPGSSRSKLDDLLLNPRLKPLIETEAVQQWLAARKKRLEF